MRPTDFDIDRVISYLQGTTNTLSGALEELYPDMTEEDLTSSDYDKIDNEIFLCATCGWWCEISEQSEKYEDETVCIDHDDED